MSNFVDNINVFGTISSNSSIYASNLNILNWNSSYTTLTANSANWNSVYKILTGGTLSGDLTITGNLSVQGTTTYIDTNVSVVSTMFIDTNSSNTALRITQTGSGDVFRVEDDTNPDSTPFIINNAGSVGIGTSTPNEKLTVVGNVSAISYYGDGSNLNGISQNNSTIINPLLSGYRTSVRTVTATTSVLSSDVFVLASANIVTTYASFVGLRATTGSVDGTGTGAFFRSPYGLTFDLSGNLYIADTLNCTIRKATPAGVVTTLAGVALSVGSADGTGTAASFNNPYDVISDSLGNIYVADTNNHTIRKMTPAGVTTTFAGSAGATGNIDGVGSAARFNGPFSIAMDAFENLYVADTNNHTIRKITPAGVTTTFAGSSGITGSTDGTGSTARFNFPQGISTDFLGNLYVSDTNNHTIRKINSLGVVTTLAGLVLTPGNTDGTGSSARFNNPIGIDTDKFGNIYVVDANNNRIRRISPSGVVTTILGGGVIANPTVMWGFAINKNTDYNIYAITEQHKISNGILNYMVLTLPLASSNTGARFEIKKSDNTTNIITISSTSGNIDGDTSIVLNKPYQSVNIISHNSQYWII